jgi:hypothetical protein
VRGAAVARVGVRLAGEDRCQLAGAGEEEWRAGGEHASVDLVDAPHKSPYELRAPLEPLLSLPKPHGLAILNQRCFP